MKFTVGSPPTVSAAAVLAIWRRRFRKLIWRNYILLLERHGIAFKYLLNGACFGNREWTRPWQKRVTALLTELGEWDAGQVADELWSRLQRPRLPCRTLIVTDEMPRREYTNFELLDSMETSWDEHPIANAPSCSLFSKHEEP